MENTVLTATQMPLTLNTTVVLRKVQTAMPTETWVLLLLQSGGP
jgi:hypothetical protein